MNFGVTLWKKSIGYPFAFQGLLKKADSISISDISTELILSFLDHLEEGRQTSRATRNLRLCALKSLAKMIRLFYPEQTETADRILNIPQKRNSKPLFGYLTQDELLAVFDTVDLPKRRGCGTRRSSTSFLTPGPERVKLQPLRSMTSISQQKPWASSARETDTDWFSFGPEPFN